MSADDLVAEMQQRGAEQRRAEAAQRKADLAAWRAQGLGKQKKRGTPEMTPQEAVVSWLRKAGCTTSRNINELRSDEKDPNKRARFWAKLVRTGVTKSFPDLTVLLPDGRTVYVEMKAPGKRLTDDQAKMHALLERQGHVVVWGVDIWSVQAALVQRGIVIARTGKLAAAGVRVGKGGA